MSDDLNEIADDYTGEKYQPVKADLHSFVNYYKGDLAKGSIIQYLRFLAELDFDPLAEKPEPKEIDIDDFHLDQFQRWTRKKSRTKFGTSDGKSNSRHRYQYLSFLSLKKYIKSQKPKLLQYLPESRSFTKPTSQKHTLKYTEDQIQDMMMAVSNNRKLFLGITLMYYGGMRSFELLHLTPEWLEFKEERIEVEIPPEYAKGQKENREKEFTFVKKLYEQDLKKYILDHYDYDGSYEDLVENLSDQEEFEPVFNFAEDTEKTYQDLMRERHHLNQKLKDAAQRAGLNQADEFSSHKLRRSFIHKVYDSSNDLSRTAQVARHSKPNTTEEFYLQRDKEERFDTYREAFS